MIIDNEVKNLRNLIKIKMNDFEAKLTKQITRIDGLSPLKIMSRGYLVSEKGGKILKSVTDIKEKDIIKLNYYDGIAETTVNKIQLNDKI